jgi:hypothetical protein
MKTKKRLIVIKIYLLTVAFLALPVAVHAQFTYITNNGAITITGYTGSGGNVTIPATINGLPVTSIGDEAFSGSPLISVTIPDSVTSIGDGAFYNCESLTSVTIPDSVTSIGYSAFYLCYNLANVAMGNGVTSIGDSAFADTALTSVTIPNSVASIGASAFADTALISVTIPDSVTAIGNEAFEYCYTLTSVTIGDGVTSVEYYTFGKCFSLTTVMIGNSVTYIGVGAFSDCGALASVFIASDAPSVDWWGEQFDYFDGWDDVLEGATVYYLPGTRGWTDYFAGERTALWFLPNPLILNKGPGFGVQSNQFGFTISWATNLPVVVEACSNLSNPVWIPVGTNILVGGTSYFTDPQLANLSARFYRLRSP